MEHDYKLAAYYPEDLVYHKEQLLEPLGQSTIGSNTVWTEAAPTEAAQPVPQTHNVFDGSQASAAAVGLGDMRTEETIMIANEEQDEDRRLLQPGKERGGKQKA